MVSVALLNTNLAQCCTAGRVLSMTRFGISPVPLLLESSLPPLRVGTSIHPLPCLHQFWWSWRRPGEHLPDFDGQACFAHTSISRRFADPRVVMWFAFSSSLPQMLRTLSSESLPAAFPKAQGCSPHQPPCHSALVSNPESPEETDLYGSQLRLYEVRSVALCGWKQAPDHGNACKGLANNFLVLWEFGALILVL